MGLVIKDNGIQAVYGPKADVLKSDVQDLLDSGVEIPKVDVSGNASSEEKHVEYKGVTENVASVADGETIKITDVKDPVFSKKMMGDGFAVEPTGSEVYAPVSGKVTNVFPTKHAVGLKGEPFDVKVKEGQTVNTGDLLAVCDWDKVKQAGKGTTIVVAFTNMDAVKEVKIDKLGQTSSKTVVGSVEL